MASECAGDAKHFKRIPFTPSQIVDFVRSLDGCVGGYEESENIVRMALDDARAAEREECVLIIADCLTGYCDLVEDGEAEPYHVGAHELGHQVADAIRKRSNAEK